MRSKFRQKSIGSSKITWLPIDSRILPSLFTFGHIRGVAKTFLIIEMLLAGFVVTGTLLLVGIAIFI